MIKVRTTRMQNKSRLYAETIENNIKLLFASWILLNFFFFFVFFG